jgi:hypothetical protein
VSGKIADVPYGVQRFLQMSRHGFGIDHCLYFVRQIARLYLCDLAQNVL